MLCVKSVVSFMIKTSCWRGSVVRKVPGQAWTETLALMHVCLYALDQTTFHTDQSYEAPGAYQLYLQKPSGSYCSPITNQRSVWDIKWSHSHWRQFPAFQAIFKLLCATEKSKLKIACMGCIGIKAIGELLSLLLHNACRRVSCVGFSKFHPAAPLWWK